MSSPPTLIIARTHGDSREAEVVWTGTSQLARDRKLATLRKRDGDAYVSLWLMPLVGESSMPIGARFRLPESIAIPHTGEFAIRNSS